MTIRIVIFLLPVILGLRFVSYLPSSWEREWLVGILNDEFQDLECETMALDKHLHRALFSVWQAQIWANQTVVNDRPRTTFEPELIFSKMRYIDDRGNTHDRFIEPLVGILRDPLTICDNIAEWAGRFTPMEDFVQAKRYIVHDFAMINSLAPHANLILMDLGASTYSGWNGDQSAVGSKWFVDRITRNTNVNFDRIIAFEAAQTAPSDVYSGLPHELYGRFVYINLPVSPNPTEPTHPWNILLSIVNPDDYVIVKLDIDTPHVEMPLIHQLINNVSYSNVVDELFFEHHVNIRAMQYYWGLDGTIRLKHSYELFTALRKIGVRAHSWP